MVAMCEYGWHYDKDKCERDGDFSIITDGFCGLDSYTYCATHMMPMKFQKGHWSHWAGWLIKDEGYIHEEDEEDKSYWFDYGWDGRRPVSEGEFWYLVSAQARTQRGVSS